MGIVTGDKFVQRRPVGQKPVWQAGCSGIQDWVNMAMVGRWLKQPSGCGDDQSLIAIVATKADGSSIQC